MPNVKRKKRKGKLINRQQGRWLYQRPCCHSDITLTAHQRMIAATMRPVNVLGC